MKQGMTLLVKPKPCKSKARMAPGVGPSAVFSGGVGCEFGFPQPEGCRIMGLIWALNKYLYYSLYIYIYIYIYIFLFFAGGGPYKYSILYPNTLFQLLRCLYYLSPN